jgi:G3E family GTPase
VGIKMNIIKRIIKRIKKQNPYVEKQLENADIIVGEKENLTREERLKRFDDYYKAQDEKHWKAGHKK